MLDFHDPVSSITHLVMAAWAVFATLILIRMTRGQGRVKRLTIAGYGASMVFLYLASGLFHGLRYETLQTLSVFRDFDQKDIFFLFRNIDRSAIFLLIDGSFAPPFVYLLRGPTRVACFATMAALTLAGLGALWFLPDLPHSATVGVYFGLALVGMVPVRTYVRAIGWPGSKWMLGIVVTYTIGAAAEASNWPVILPGVFGYHEILHISDMGGTLIHFIFVVKFLIGPRMKARVHENRSIAPRVAHHPVHNREGMTT